MECISCLEIKPKEKHTICRNGHSAGCQKCHMLLLKSKYEKKVEVYGDDSEKNTQCCFTCREPIPDANMGEDWKKNMNILQPLMMMMSLNIPKDKKNEISLEATQRGLNSI